MTPIERAGRALCEAEQMDPDANLGPQDDPHPQWWFYIERVEAVLKAIREPSLEMKLAGAPKITMQMPRIGAQSDYDAADDSWKAMIDALLD